MPLILPLDVELDEVMKQDFGKLPRGTTVPMIIPDAEDAIKGIFLNDLFSKPIHRKPVTIQFFLLVDVNLPRMLKDKRYVRVYVGNGVWDHLDEATRAISK